MVTREQQIRRTEANRDAWIENNNATGAPQHNQTVLVASSINGALDSVRQLASTVQQVKNILVSLQVLTKTYKFLFYSWMYW